MNYAETHSKTRAEIKNYGNTGVLDGTKLVAWIIGIPLTHRSYAAVQRQWGCHLCAAQ